MYQNASPHLTHLEKGILLMHTHQENPVGIIVARFQVHRLHAGHRALINYVRARHAPGDVLIVLGSSEFPTPKNPLPYLMRRKMVYESFKDVMIATVRDHPSNEEWSRRLDTAIAVHFPGRAATLYGSRNCFFSAYQGTHQTHEVPEFGAWNGTATRRKLAEKIDGSAEFRAGIIHAYETRLPVTRPMVDIAVMRNDRSEVLLAGKRTDPEHQWRFLGGLVDPTDVSLEMAARREAMEEASMIEVSDPTYVGSMTVNDWRYRGSGEFGHTMLFVSDFVFGGPRPSDDVSRLRWVPIEKMCEHLIDMHRPLGEMLTGYLAKKS